MNTNEKNRVNVIRRLVDSKKPVKIYGSGKFAKFAALLIIESGIKLEGFVDDEKYYYPGKKIEVNGVEYLCENINSVNTEDDSYNMVVGIQDYRKMAYIKEKFSDKILVEWVDNVDYHYMQKGFLDKYKSEIGGIRDELCDEESKLVLDEFFNARYTGNPENLVKLVHDDKNTYDWDLLGVSEDDIIVDGGAYTGDTIDEIMQLCGGRIKKIYAFEPDEKNYEKLKNNISENYENVVAVKAGLYSKDTILRFESFGTMGSSVEIDGEESIDVVALDKHEEYKDVSLIKMDIEGSECDAIKGAMELIKRNKPRLAICIYHNNDDIIKIFELLKKMDYRYYLRQHGYCAEETVLYAISES